MANITTHELRLALTRIEYAISQNLFMVTRYESPHKYYLRLEVKDHTKTPEYIAGPMTRKELLDYLNQVYFFMELAN